jgi:hypothetical protein
MTITRECILSGRIVIESFESAVLSGNPLVDSCRAQLASLRLIYLDAGSRDEFNLQFGTRIFCDKLRKHGTVFLQEEFDDGHLNIPYRFDRSLAALSDAMPAVQAAPDCQPASQQGALRR